MKKFIKPLVPKKILEKYHAVRKKRLVLNSLQPKFQRFCPACEQWSYFLHWPGPPIIAEFGCPNCDSHSRQRMIAKYITSGDIKICGSVIHFAAEPILRKHIEPLSDIYKTADLYNDADLRVDVENISFADNSFDTIVINHVLEHVSDYKKGISELARILKPTGRCIITVPQQIGYSHTYQNDAIVDPDMRELHFGQYDHLRVFGRDFDGILLSNGFSRITAFELAPQDCIEMGCTAGEKVFVCEK